MAIQKRSLSSIEHDWYATRSGLTNGAPLNEHKLQYYSDKGFGSNASIFKPLGQMEGEWLASVGGRDTEGPYDLWSSACEAQSAPVGSTVDECKFNFFNKVTTSP
jgi:hypothetical protein